MSVVIMSVGIVALRGVIHFPLVNGQFQLVEHPLRFADGDVFSIHPDAPILVVVFDDH